MLNKYVAKDNSSHHQNENLEGLLQHTEETKLHLIREKHDLLVHEENDNITKNPKMHNDEECLVRENIEGSIDNEIMVHDKTIAIIENENFVYMRWISILMRFMIQLIGRKYTTLPV